MDRYQKTGVKVDVHNPQQERERTRRGPAGTTVKAQRITPNRDLTLKDDRLLFVVRRGAPPGVYTFET